MATTSRAPPTATPTPLAAIRCSLLVLTAARCCTPASAPGGPTPPAERLASSTSSLPACAARRQRGADHADGLGVLLSQDHPGLPPPLPAPLTPSPSARPRRSGRRSPPSTRPRGPTSSTPTVAWRRSPRPAIRGDRLIVRRTRLSAPRPSCASATSKPASACGTALGQVRRQRRLAGGGQDAAPHPAGPTRSDHPLNARLQTHLGSA
jgi:hypothetical protein